MLSSSSRGAPAASASSISASSRTSTESGRSGRAELEVSGGVDEETVLVYATIPGVHYVSMGALTHSAPGLDLSLSLESLSP